MILEKVIIYIIQVHSFVVNWLRIERFFKQLETQGVVIPKSNL